MNRLLIIFGIIILAANAQAEIILLSPTNESIVEISAKQGEKLTQTILVQNNSRIIEYATPHTDLNNAQFNPTSFGLDPNVQRKVVLTIIADKNEKAKVFIGEQSFTVKINIVEPQDSATILFQKLEKTQPLILMIMILVAFILIGILMAKVWKT